MQELPNDRAVTVRERDPVLQLTGIVYIRGSWESFAARDHK